MHSTRQTGILVRELIGPMLKQISDCLAQVTGVLSRAGRIDEAESDSAVEAPNVNTRERDFAPTDRTKNLREKSQEV